MSTRLQWSLVTATAVLLVAVLLGLAAIRAGSGTGAVQAVIDPGSTSRIVDVALIDASGREYAGENRGAGQSETLQLIPAGRVQVNVGACSTSALVAPGRTTVVHFRSDACIR